MNHILLILAIWFSWHPIAWPESLPPLADLDHFPSCETCEDQLAFLAARRTYLDNLHGLYPAPVYANWFADVIADVNDRERPWMVLHEIHYDRPWTDAGRWERQQRCRLAELRRLLGERDFNAGVMPAAIDPIFWNRIP